ncbi:hypothetical protein KKD37_01225 [Patescibacteria group bacterium]|nr:hypothetical protein [Patescibacteria group bacterium]
MRKQEEQPRLFDCEVDETAHLTEGGKLKARHTGRDTGEDCHHEQTEITGGWNVAGITKAQPTGDRK